MLRVAHTTRSDFVALATAAVAATQEAPSPVRITSTLDERLETVNDYRYVQRHINVCIARENGMHYGEAHSDDISVIAS